MQSIANLAAALVKAQAEIEGATKDKVNPHFRSKYADLGAVVDAVKPALVKHGLAYVQVSHDRDHAAAIETLIVHQSGETLSCGVVSVPVSKGDAQGYGSAMTYARRYSLSAAFGVAPEDDDGNAAAAAKPKPNTPTQQMKDELEKETPENQEWLQRVAQEVEHLLVKEGPEQAYAHMMQELPDIKAENERHNDLRMALNSLFTPKTKNALREQGSKSYRKAA